MQATAESLAAETARSQQRETRAAMHAAIDVRCDELTNRIDSSEVGKAASLECELIAVNAALERSRPCQTSISSRNSPLSSRLDEMMEAHLHALPTDVVEPPIVGLLARSAG